MKKTIPATDIGKKDIGYAIVALLSTETKRKIQTLQAQLSKELPGLIWTMPFASLHSTLCEIIQPKDYIEDKATIYENRHREFEAAIEEVLSNSGPISVTFNKIEASPHAIVIMGEDNGIFNQIRAELLQKTTLPDETKQPPSVVHSSIARYTKEVNLSKVQLIIDKHSILSEEAIDEFQLMHPISPHLLHFKIVKRYSLD